MDSLLKKIWMIPLIIVLLWCGKNWWYFGVFGTSSWGSMSFAKMTTLQLSESVRDSLIRYNRLSQMSMQPAFPSLWRVGVRGTVGFQHRIKLYPHTPFKTIHILDTTNFKANGRNMNHWVYLELSKLLKKDNSWVLNHYPKLFYFKAVPNAWRMCFKPTWSWFRNDAGPNSHRRAGNLFVIQDIYRLWGASVDWSIVAIYITSTLGGLWLIKNGS